MAQIALTAGTQLLRTAASTLASTAASWALNAALGSTQHGRRLAELQIQTSSEGAAMPRVWGRARLAGQVIWASHFKEHARKSRPGGKASPSRIDYGYSVSFAVGLCEGPISGIGRIWAHGTPIDPDLCSWRVHSGAEDQMPDALIAAIEGAAAPAFRGTAYIVFEDMPLDLFGSRIPNLTVEVFRRADEAGMETRISGVNLIPGSGEFAYHTDTVMRQLGPGREVAENRNNARGQPDLLVALDDLERDLPHCRSVQVVICWFGDDLRCGECRIRPGVETRDKSTRPVTWQVAGLSRSEARLVSQNAGRPVYGGTPDDAGIIAAIHALKARGFRVTLYPFILMDIPEDNALPRPDGSGDGQPVHPWRGRIAASTGPEAVSEQMRRFFGAARAQDYALSAAGQVEYAGPAEWGLRRFILHCAALGEAAGGVDGFLIGSELVGVTTSRDAEGGFPAVAELIDLAREARSLLGPSCRISYAADWTEYSGWQDGTGAKIFHLDPLWVSDDIDAVAIDWYVPLSDWRDEAGHLDADGHAGADDPDYLAAQVTGGEGYDWFYPDEAARQAQARHPITDPQHDEAWIWRSKDLLNWWRSPHHDRPDGQRSAQPTPWQPRSKPIWLTEIGCPAIDKGANQPNVFVDPKSSESRKPWFSSGARDDRIARRYLEAVLAHWEDAEANPVSPLYGGPMVEADWIHTWAWDARPWPDFPARQSVWSDGANWATGHWLNGRAGQVPLAGIIDDLCRETGLTDWDTSRVTEILSGYVGQGGQSAREILAPLVALFGLDVFESSDGVVFGSPGLGQAPTIALDPHARPDVEEDRHRAPEDRPGDVRLSYFDDTADYNPGEARAREDGDADRGDLLPVPVLADPDLAARWCRALLERQAAQDRTLSRALPPSSLALDIGDTLICEGETWRIGAADDSIERQVELVSPIAARATAAGSSPGSGRAATPPAARAVIQVCDVAGLAPEDAQTFAVIAAFAHPWNGPRRLWMRSPHSAWSPRETVSVPAVMGELATDLPAGPVGRWDRAATCELRLYGGELSSRTGLDVLNGANRLAVNIGAGEWAVLQFRTADLLAPRYYQLHGLLRGLAGTSASAISAGAACVLLDEGLSVIELGGHETGVDLQVTARAQGAVEPGPDEAGTRVNLKGLAHRPFAPVHVRLRRRGPGWRLGWIRRSRIGGDDWQSADIPLGERAEAYRVTLHDGDRMIGVFETDTPFLVLSSADLVDETGDLPHAIDIAIAQFSGIFGWGQAGCARRVL